MDMQLENLTPQPHRLALGTERGETETWLASGMTEPTGLSKEGF